MAKIRYTLVVGRDRWTVNDLQDVGDALVRDQAERHLRAWSQSVRTQALRYVIEQEAGEEVARQMRVCYTPCEDKI